MTNSAAKSRQLLIGGEWVDGADGGYEVVNPATEEVVGLAPEASAAQAIDAARAAQEAFPAWSQTSPERARRAAAEDGRRDARPLRRPAAARHRRDRLHRDRRQADAGAASARCASTRTHGYAFESPVIPLPPMEMPQTALAPGGLMGAIARRQPVGAVACITPYNFPIVNMAGKLGPALAMGNTVVVRPASQNPLAVIELVQLMHDVGFPPGVVNVVTGSTPDTGEALVESRDIDMVSFTGSTGVGTRIGEVGGRTMKRLLLELGGKGGALVFDDANLKTAIQMIGSTWTFHSGQICTAPTRAIIQRGVYDQVVEGLAQDGERAEGRRSLRAGHGARARSSRAAHRDRVEGYIEAGRDRRRRDRGRRRPAREARHAASTSRRR